MAQDFSTIKISEAIRFAEEQAEIERQTPSLIEPDSPERYASWASMVHLLRYMKGDGVPDSMKDD